MLELAIGRHDNNLKFVFIHMHNYKMKHRPKHNDVHINS